MSRGAQDISILNEDMNSVRNAALFSIVCNLAYLLLTHNRPDRYLVKLGKLHENLYKSVE